MWFKVPITTTPAPADFSGWYRVAGTGTNAATTIQADLDAAYSQRSSPPDEYTYLDSTAGVVTLPKGKKIYIAPTGTNPTLVIPQGVTLDLNGSTLFCGVPASATNQWAAVVMKHGAKLRNGRIFPVADVVWPGYAGGDYRLTYDGVRIFESDGDAHVDTVEIKGFRGAAIRVIGSWNTTIENCRFLSCSYGIVMSKLGDAFTATAYTRRRASTDDRCTSTYIRGCRFTSLPLMGILAAASGESGDAHINSDDFAAHTTMIHIEDCYFENIASFAIRCLASWPKITNCTFEEVGNVNGVMEFSVCKGPVLTGCEYIRDGSATNITRHSNTAVNDTVTPNPGAFIRATQSNTVKVFGLTTNISAGGGLMTFVRTATSTGLLAMGVDHIGTFGFPGTDGDITIAPTATGLYAYGHDAHVPVVDRGGQVYNVKSYGAVGDGSTDDTTTINAAITAANTAGGGIVQFPLGTFICNAALQMRSNVILRGSGYGTVLKLKSAANCNVIEEVAGSGAGSTISRVVIENLRIDGNKANQTNDTESYGVALQYVTDSIVRGVWVHDTVRTGIYLGGSRNTVTGCFVKDAGKSGGSAIGKSGIVCDTDNGTNNPVQSIVTDNHVENTIEHGIKIYPDGTGSVVSGNTLKTLGDRGIYVQEANGVSVTGNTVEAATTQGIYVVGTSTADPILDATVTGNTVIDGSDQGINVHFAKGATVSGNTVKGNDGNGIYLLSSSGCTVAGNTCTANGTDNSKGGAGITLVSSPSNTVTGNTCRNNGNATNAVGIWSWDSGTASTDVVCTGNRSYDDQATKVQKYGIRTQNNSDYWCVTGNNCRGNDTASISLAGANNKNDAANNIT